MVKLLVYNFGHHKIQKNLEKGFFLLGIDYKFSENQRDIENYDLIYSSGQILDYKKYQNKKFIFGPNMTVFPNNNTNFSNNDKNVTYIQPSKWVVDMWKKDFNYSFENLKVYPVGVDTEEFCPKNDLERDKVIIYFKHRNVEDLNFIKSFLNSKNIIYEIFHYGSYSEANYKNILNKAKYGIWIDAHESEGFATLEALSMNVPLLVWNIRRMCQEQNSPQEYHKIEGKATSIPYWDERCGEYFYEKEEFAKTFDLFLKKIDLYKPREYILENLELKKQTQKLLEL